MNEHYTTSPTALDDFSQYFDDLSATLVTELGQRLAANARHHGGVKVYYLEDRALHERLVGIANTIGFVNILRIVFIRRPLSAPVLVVTSDMSSELKSFYWQTKGYEHDVTWKHCLRSTEPLIWQNIERTPESEALWDARRRQGVDHGLSLAVHDINGVKTMISMARATPLDLDPKVLNETLRKATELAYFSHTASMQSIFPSLKAREVPKFSAREYDCIQWMGRGKTAGEIAQILYISEETVVFHTKKIIVKLGASNKFHAIAIAASLGLVRSDESAFVDL